MTTKKLLSIILISLSLSIGAFSWLTNAFVSGSSENFFLNIDKGIENIKDKSLSKIYDSQEDTLADRLNANAMMQKLHPIFIPSDGIIDSVKYIWDSQNPELLRIIELNKIVSISSIDTQYLDSYLKIVEDFHNANTYDANTSSEYFTKLQKIWVFSDWTLENSEFDLLVDMENIDSIIFWVEWTYSDVLWEAWWALWWLSEAAMDMRDSTYETLPNFWWWDWLSNPWAFIKKTQTDKRSNSTNMNQSWINIWDYTSNSAPQYQWNIDFDNLITCDANLGNFDWSDLNTPIVETNVWPWNLEDTFFKPDFSYTPDEETLTMNNVFNWIYSTLDEAINSAPTYSPFRNSFWCKAGSMFCITIEAINYPSSSNNGDQKSIDFVITKSNEYLEEWAFTSKIQSKMTTNNFELNFNDLQLADIFSTWVIFEEKPVPFLDTRDNKDNSFYSFEWTYEWILEKWFSNIWMDYKRPNDLSKILETWKTSQLLDQKERYWINAISKEIEKINKIEENNSLKNEVLFRNIEAITWTNTDFNDFANQFDEFAWFLTALDNYTHNLESMVALMEKIEEK